jgi:FixJ family two-component response regulator
MLGRQLHKTVARITRHEECMKPVAPLVSVVDDDESVRESLPDLLREFGYAAKGFAAPRDFLESKCIDQTKCLILDVAMPEMSGPELRKELVERGYDIPTIFITAHAQAGLLTGERNGIVACLIKPFSDAQLLEALKKALDLKNR